MSGSRPALFLAARDRPAEDAPRALSAAFPHSGRLLRALACVAVLASAAHAEPAPLAPEELRHELFDRVVIADARRDWGAGPIKIEQVPGEHDVRLVMTRAIDPKAVPAALRAWRGRKVIVGRDATRCASEVTGLQLLGVTEPESELGFWDGASAPLPARGAALAIWNEAHVWLVGELSDTCLGTTWVRAADLKVPAVVAPLTVTGSLRDEALAAFRALPAYRAVAARFRGGGAWDASGGGPRSVLRFDLPNRTLIAYGADVRDGPLDEQLLAVWELPAGPQPRLKLRQVAATAALPRLPFRLLSAMNLRGDGRVLFTYATRDGRGALYEQGDRLVDVPSLRLATP
jgi:hypothetical protein